MNVIKEYLQKETSEQNAFLERAVAKFEAHPDIAKEFEYWITTKEYKKDSPVQIEGYTAESISKLAPFLNGAGVFSFMITLREQPDVAKAQIAAKFPRK